MSPRLAQAGHSLSLPTLSCGEGSWAPAQVTDARPSRWPRSPPPHRSAARGRPTAAAQEECSLRSAAHPCLGSAPPRRRRPRSVVSPSPSSGRPRPGLAACVGHSLRRATWPHPGTSAGAGARRGSGNEVGARGAGHGPQPRQMPWSRRGPGMGPGRSGPWCALSGRADEERPGVRRRACRSTAGCARGRCSRGARDASAVAFDASTHLRIRSHARRAPRRRLCRPTARELLDVGLTPPAMTRPGRARGAALVTTRCAPLSRDAPPRAQHRHDAVTNGPRAGGATRPP